MSGLCRNTHKNANPERMIPADVGNFLPHGQTNDDKGAFLRQTLPCLFFSCA
jgi:hypothetical protein